MRWVATNDEDEEDHYGYNDDGGDGDGDDCDDDDVSWPSGGNELGGHLPDSSFNSDRWTKIFDS